MSHCSNPGLEYNLNQGETRSLAGDTAVSHTLASTSSSLPLSSAPDHFEGRNPTHARGPPVSHRRFQAPHVPSNEGPSGLNNPFAIYPPSRPALEDISSDSEGPNSHDEYFDNP